MLPNQTCLTSCWVGKRAGEGKTQKFRGRESICFGGHVSSALKKKGGGTDPCSTPTGLPVAVTWSQRSHTFHHQLPSHRWALGVDTGLGDSGVTG